MSSPASPLPEGRADGRAEAIEQVMQRLRSMLRFGHEDAARELLVRFWLAAPVVAVPEAGERAEHDDVCAEMQPHYHRDTADGEELVFLAPAVPVGVQPESEVATSATDRAVPTRPEPAEVRCEHRYSTREVLMPRATCVRCGHVSIRPRRSTPAVPERQIAAVRQALDMEGNVHDRGDFDRGIQAACSRIRRAMDDPKSFLNPTPAVPS